MNTQLIQNTSSLSDTDEIVLIEVGQIRFYFTNLQFFLYIFNDLSLSLWRRLGRLRKKFRYSLYISSLEYIVSVQSNFKACLFVRQFFWIWVLLFDSTFAFRRSASFCSWFSCCSAWLESIDPSWLGEQRWLTEEYLVNILIMPERHFHFHSVVAARLQDHPVACLQLRKESESAAWALLK